MTAASGAQEPADPPWLTDAIEAAWESGNHSGAQAIRAALPILRAGIEQELREKLAAAIDAEPTDEFWTRADAAMAVRQIRRQS